MHNVFFKQTSHIISLIILIKNQDVYWTIGLRHFKITHVTQKMFI